MGNGVVHFKKHQRWVWFAIAMLAFSFLLVVSGIPYIVKLRTDLKADRDSLRKVRTFASRNDSIFKKTLADSNTEWVRHMSNDSTHAVGDQCLVALADFGNLDDKIKPASRLRLRVSKRHSQPLRPTPTPADRSALAVAADSCPQKLDPIIDGHSNAQQLLRKAKSRAEVLKQPPR